MGCLRRRLICCSRLSDPRHTLRSIVGDELAAKAKDIWGLDEEGELKGCYADSGLEGMWNIMGTTSSRRDSDLADLLVPLQGNLALCRFYSKHIALRKFQNSLRPFLMLTSTDP